ncbi:MULTISPECIES: MoaD/ThiS family protein [Comamonas]|uniref:MoaD/ThiS family protein n=1 Tax=Comamonas TaxID=283 RepID=UPI0001DA68DD|nr:MULTISPECIES: MoaD/ThiS family protein [Comamonas]EFI60759.1 hypothetical protein CTS44_15093 [Comamonas thiooxydans]TFF63125.1 MoaD/ThiS family protein [Comamonas sp. A23]
MALMPTLSVIWCPNPLRPASDRKVLPVALAGSETLHDIVERLGLADTPLAIMSNGRPVAAEDWAATPVSVSDLIVIHQVAKGIVEGSTVAAKLVMYGEIGWTAAFALGTVAAFAANAVIAFAISALAGSLSARSATSAKGDDAPTAYSIEGGSNSARNYEPLQLVLGEHRVFPDYAGRPFGEFVPDPSTATEVINNTPVYETRTHPPFGFEGTAVIAPWVLIRTDVWESGTIEYYGDQASRTYTSSSGGTVTQPHTFVVSHQGLFDSVTTYEDYLVQITPPESGGGD